LIVVATACGQKGPPLPPIVRTPAPPVIHADRRGSTIEVELSVPNANVDGSRPANLTRIDIYAVNGPATNLTDNEILARGTKVASLPVKSPRTASDTIESDESAENLEPTVGEGLEQGASSEVKETITESLLESTPSRNQERRGDGSRARMDAPLVDPAALTQVRTYVGVGVDAHGHVGRFSKRVSVPLQLPPPPPPPIAISYDEKTIVITWKPVDQPGDEDVLPSRSFGPLQPSVLYNLYDATTGELVNGKPVAEYGYEDKRMDWGTKRCYEVRSVEFIAKLPIESDATGPTCEMLVDTFPPAAPKGLNAVSTDGAINLIWEPNVEPDLAGYYVLRASGDEPLQRITAQPVTEPSFFDNVKSGVRFTYAVQAVDKAGNISPHSNSVEETAR
jgi:hypothetical protein